MTQNEQGRLVYGEYWLHECFALLDEELAEGLAEEIEAIQACRTVGDVRRLEPTLAFTWVPDIDFDDDECASLPDEAPYDWSSTCAVADGDWPPMPDSYALDNLPRGLLRELIANAGAEVIDTVLNGPYFAILLDKEDDLLTVLRSAGYEVRRDDGLISRIAIYAKQIPVSP